MVSIVLKDAYLQVPVHPDSRQFLRFVVDRKVLSVSCALFWPFHGSSGLHQGHGSCFGDASCHGRPDTPVSGRLAVGEERGSVPVQSPRHCYQRGEVLSSTDSDIDLPGNGNCEPGAPL